MRGDEQVIDYLNRALKHELTAVNQYWLHYRMLDNWGYKDFAKTWRKESIEEMQHADQLVARILFLDGLPNLQSLDQLRIGQNVKEILECDLAAEMRCDPLSGNASAVIVSPLLLIPPIILAAPRCRHGPSTTKRVAVRLLPPFGYPAARLSKAT